MNDEKIFIEIPDQLEVKDEIKTIIDRGLQQRKLSLSRPTLTIAASFLAVLLTLGFVFPTHASQLPFVGDFFERYFFDHDQRDKVAEITMQVGQEGRARGAEEGRGIKITIEEAVFDGRSIYLSYILESEFDLEDYFVSISISDFAVRFDGYRTTVNAMRSGSGSSSTGFDRICDDTYLYAGMTMFHIRYHPRQNFERSGDATLSVLLSGTIFTESGFVERFDFQSIGLERGQYELSPDEFRFPLERIKTDIYVLDEAIEIDEFHAVVEHVHISTLGIGIQVRGNGDFDLEFYVYDDLGNQYSWFGSGGNGFTALHNFIGIIPPEANQLIITPFLRSTYEAQEPIILSLR